MKVGIMQPYFLPYIGYWQLMNAVDRYVIYDDVNFIKGGWINRNRILLNGQPHYLNVPMVGASSNKKIMEIEVNTDPRLINKNLRILQAAYAKAPYFPQTFPIAEKILNCGCTKLGEYLIYSIKVIAEHLGIQTELIISSQIDKNTSLHGQDKVLDICSRLGATEYYNAIGGMGLYCYEIFREHNIELKFLEPCIVEYQQFGTSFQPNLSILDLLMFNPLEDMQHFLQRYSLISREGKNENCNRRIF